MPEQIVFGTHPNLIDHSGTVTAANTSQVVIIANGQRKGFSIQNQHASAVLWINENGVAAIAGQPSIQLAAGQTYTTPPFSGGQKAVSVLSATAGLPFAAREF